MERTITYQIQAEDADIRVEQFLRRRSYSRKNLADLKSRNGSTQINGKACRLNQRLLTGVLQIRILENASSERIPATALPLTILYEDEDILVVDKPAGLPMHPSRDNYYYSLANAVMYHYKDCGGFVFRCTNRLDRDTSGLAVIAKHSVSASILGAMTKGSGSDFRKCETSQSKPGSYMNFMEREYLAVVCGILSPKSGTVDAPISRKQPRKADCFQFQQTQEAEVVCPLSERSIERCVDFEHGERAVTHYHVLETKNGYSLVSVLLETGRTHQIRVHMAYLGHPLAGDYLYHPECRRAAAQTNIELPTSLIWGFQGTQKTVLVPGVRVPADIHGISRQALHACRLKFPHPITGEIMEFRSPLPEDMRRFYFSIS
ncbi:MAG: RluA family pseudouridine synthase [Clostridiales bacterium]|nr:RluA family pseudouridine synthase [Clostridiales bacterium]